MNIARLGIKDWLCRANSSKIQAYLLHHSRAKFIVLVTVFSMFFSTIPLSFVNAMTSESYWNGNVYPVSLIENGSNSAGRKSSDAEFIFHPTSKWTTLSADLESGNFLFIVNIFELSGTSLIIPFGLTYNSFNSTEDVGVGKGWMTNLHSCVFENPQTGSITYMTSSGAKLEFQYDSQNQNYINPYGFKGKIEKIANGYTVTLLGGSTINFDTFGKLISTEPPCGVGYTVSYSNGRPSAVTDNLNQNCKYTLTWNTNGKLVSITDGMNHTWTLVYNQNETQLISITQPTQGLYSCSFSYDLDNLLTGHNDFHGVPYTVSYNTNSPKQISSWTVPSSNETSFTYSTPAAPFSKKTEISDPENSKTNYFFGGVSNKLEKISQFVNTQELKKTFSYNTNGWVISSKDSYENETIYMYDNVGNLIKSINPPAITGGTQFSIERTYSPSNDVLGLLVSSKEKASPNLWNETTYLYGDTDAPCKPSIITNALAEETIIDYNNFGQIISITKQTQTGTKTKTYQYDQSNGKLVLSSDYIGNETAYIYNNNGKEIQNNRFEGTIATGVPVSITTTNRDENNSAIGSSDSITNETTSHVFGKNGELTDVTNKSGCSSSTVYTKSINNELTLAPAKDVKTSPVDSSIFPNSVLANHASSVNLQSTPKYSPNVYSQTDSMNRKTEFTYKNNGLLNTLTNYIGYEKTYSYDSINRLHSISQPDGNNVSISYNNNCLKTIISSTRDGITQFTYDNCSRISTKIDPVSGLTTYSYTVRGDILSDEKGSYSYDLLGRKTSISYADGSTNPISYTKDGYVSSQNGVNRTFDLSGNTLSWGNGVSNASYSYQGGFSSLGLPSSISGQGEISSYNFQYNNKYLLSSINNSDKPQGIFAYTYSDQKKLTSLSNPNSTQLIKTYSNKISDKIKLINTQTQETYLDIDSDFNSFDQRTSYGYSVNAGQNLFEETSSIGYKTGNNLGKVSSITSQYQNRSVSYDYDSLNGLINTLLFSDLGTFSVQHHTNGTISSINYPNNQGTASFSYNSALNKLSGITLPNDKSISLSWNSKNFVTGITCSNINSTTSYVLNYNNNNQVTYIEKTVDGMKLNYWNFYYGPNGLEKAIKFDYSLDFVSITQNFTTDTKGRLLSMTYDDIAGSSQTPNGEYYFHSDAFGNICLLTDSNGQPVASYQYDLHNGKVFNEWNPGNIENIFMQGGLLGTPTIPLPLESGGTDFIVIPKNANFVEIGLDPGLIVIDIPTKGVDLRHNPWKGIKILSEDDEECKPCPEGEYHVWTCMYNCYEFSPTNGDGEFLAIEISEHSKECTKSYYTLKNYEGRDVKVHCIRFDKSVRCTKMYS